jgi:hypothetical protein
MLEGVDDVDWPALAADPAAADVPELLRLLVSGPPRPSLEAFRRLVRLLAPQPAATAAVPFLIELAGDPAVRHRAHLVWLLGRRADPDAVAGGTVEPTYRALRRHLPALLALLRDGDPQMREAAVYAAAQCANLGWRADRWAVETDPMVRATLLYAARSPDRIPAALEDGATAVRMAAALLTARGGLPWTPAATAVVCSTSDRGHLLAGCSWVPYKDYLFNVLACFDPPAGVPAELLAALFADRDLRLRTLEAVRDLVDEGRWPLGRVKPLIQPVRDDDDPEVRCLVDAITAD